MCERCIGFSGLSKNGYMCVSRRDEFRYEVRPSITRQPPVPRKGWQKSEYMRVMGQDTPDHGYEQFQYNPRTKAGKALLSDLVASQTHPTCKCGHFPSEWEETCRDCGRPRNG